MKRSAGARLPLAALAVAALLACACGGGESGPALAVESARAFAPPGSGGGAVYLTLVNRGGEDDRLLAVSTPAARRAELHEMVSEDGVMKMRAYPDGMPVPAGETTVLAPGGRHLMLMGLTAPLSVGEELTLTLRFAHAGERTVTAPVVADPEAAP